jgi:hypothetical protein
MGSSSREAPSTVAFREVLLEQGASLDPVQLQGASFEDACVWRADARQAAWQDTSVARPETSPKPDKFSECYWTATTFAELNQLIAKEIPEGDARRVALGRIERNLDPTKDLKGEKEMAENWAARESESPTPDA